MPTSQQNYSNHIRYYIPHHVVFYSLMLGLLVVGTYCTIHFEDRRLEWGIITFLSFMVAFLSFMLRQHYALGNQNRIVRLELRLRYFQLTGKRLESIEQQLSFGQLAALRFAGDEELLTLLEKTLKENTSPDAIKKSIKNWVADEMRL